MMSLFADVTLRCLHLPTAANATCEYRLQVARLLSSQRMRNGSERGSQARRIHCADRAGPRRGSPCILARRFVKQSACDARRRACTIAHMDSIEAAVIGGGVVGLAVGRALAMQGVETLVIERHARPGEETTSRNSGVIHSGIYYPAGSLKAAACVRGRELLYRYCEERGIRHQRCGKIVVAGESQVAALQALYKRGIVNGVLDLEILDRAQVASLEPAVVCAAGLLSPSTGIIDVHELLLALLADLEAHGGALLLQANVGAMQAADDGIVMQVDSGGTTSELQCRWLVNCAELSTPQMLRSLAGYPQQRLRAAFYAKGNYFSCQGVRPFKRLVYPMPNEAGLGVHATLD